MIPVHGEETRQAFPEVLPLPVISPNDRGPRVSWGRWGAAPEDDVEVARCDCCVCRVRRAEPLVLIKIVLVTIALFFCTLMLFRYHR
jgi:hypothetical protein